MTKIFTYSIDTTYRIYLFFIFLKFFLIEKQTHINILFQKKLLSITKKNLSRKNYYLIKINNIKIIISIKYLLSEYFKK